MSTVRWYTPKRLSGRLAHFSRNYGQRGLGWVWKMHFGPGAGYVRWNADHTKVLVHGWVVYVAWRAGSWTWKRRFRGIGSRFPLQVGITRNANAAPYTSH